MPARPRLALSTTLVGVASPRLLCPPVNPVLRTVQVGQAPVAMAVDAQAGRVFVANSRDNTVSVLDARSGVPVRMLRVDADPTGVVVDEETGRAFVTASVANTVSVLDTRRVLVLRRTMVGTDPVAAAVDARAGRVFVAAAGSSGVSGGVSELDARSGALLGTITLSSAIGVATDAVTGRAFVADQANSIFLLDSRHGPTLRPLHVQGTGLVVDERNRRVFAGAPTPHGGRVIVLDAGSGQVVQTVAVPDAPAILAVDESNGHVFAGGFHGTVTTLDERSGHLLGTVQLSPATPVVQMAVDGRTSRVFAVSQNPTDSTGQPIGQGSVTVLDAGTGAALRTITVGADPRAAVVDGQSGRVFVASSGKAFGRGSVAVLDAGVAARCAPPRQGST